MNCQCRPGFRFWVALVVALGFFYSSEYYTKDYSKSFRRAKGSLVEASEQPAGGDSSRSKSWLTLSGDAGLKAAHRGRNGVWWWGDVLTHRSTMFRDMKDRWQAGLWNTRRVPPVAA